MFYKLSNTANVEEMERMFGVTFKYPDIYLKNPLINGFNEELLPIITDKNLYKIQYGIWGILPEGYREDWSVFQKTQNTLNTDLNIINNSDKFSLDKRCIVIVTGFFLTYVYKGEIYPFYTRLKSKKPFAIAGIYNTTHDGYITCSLLLTAINTKAAKYHNIGKRQPLVISPKNYELWLSSNYQVVLDGNYDDYEALNFTSHPVAREFYKNNILFDSFLDPSEYESLSIPF